MSFWEAWWLAYWPVAMVVLLATGAEGEGAAAAVIWLQFPWMLLGWPVQASVGVWMATKRRNLSKSSRGHRVECIETGEAETGDPN